MKQLSLFTIVLFALSLWACKKDNKPEITDYQLVWSDEFNTNGLPDESKWSYDVGGSGWGNEEAQYYTNSRLENSEVKDGFLFINALKEDFEGKNYTSARLVTRTKGDWLYGKVEVRAKLPEGKGMWPAIWMLPTDWKYGDWPDSGEIDIMENLGYIPYFISATVQTQYYNFITNSQKNAITTVSDCYSEFHNYILKWDTSELRFYVDSKLYHTLKNDGAGFQTWPFDKRFHLLLNVAVGGTYGGVNGIDDSIFPQSMVVDYVRVYQKNISANPEFLLIF
ncbi:MAG TPA: glycoside hydrolase family 16 protein [Prolixibacteraceae bacterium]|nr:glycoside hydrolase family 16 protein [Prolixibacteraceae bacterium]